MHGSFCAACGQADDPIQQPVSHFIREAFSEYFGLDGRLGRSFGALFFRPGHLTLEYVGGRRVRYLRPFRLYLTATVLFFFALSQADVAGQIGVGEGDGLSAEADTLVRAEDRIDDIAAALDGLRASRAALEEVGSFTPGNPVATDQLDALGRALRLEREALRALPEDSLVHPGEVLPPDSVVAALDSAGVVPEPTDGNGFYSLLPDWLKSPVVRRMEAAETREEVREARRDLVRAVIGNVPTAMFFLLPVFAACLKVLYVSGGGLRRPTKRSPWRARRMQRRMRRPWRRAARALWRHVPLGLRARRRGTLRHVVTAKRTRYLSEHLVFALHVHAFAFFVFLLMLLLVEFGSGAWVQGPFILLGWCIPLYFVLALKRVYAQGWAKTLVKAGVIAWVYGPALVFGIFFAAALAATLG